MKFYLHRHAFDMLQGETPNLLPIFRVLCDEPYFPIAGEPAQRLKAYLLAQGLSERTWRLIAHSDGLLLQPVERFYRGDAAKATLEHLKLLDRLQIHRQPPAWFVEQLLAGWGNQGSRWESYVDDVKPEIDAWRHVARLVEHWSNPEPRVRDQFDLIRRWLIAKGRNLELSKQQRRAGWSWLLRGARAWADRRRIEVQIDPRPWPVPFAVTEIGDWVFVALSNDVELLDEARAMHNCVDKYGPRCRADGRVVISARKRGQRIAIMEVRFIEGAWHLLDAKGYCNSDLRGATIEELEDFVRQIPPPAPINAYSLLEAIQDLARAEAAAAQAEQQRMRALDDGAVASMEGDWFATRMEVSLARLRVAGRARRYGESK